MTSKNITYKYKLTNPLQFFYMYILDFIYYPQKCNKNVINKKKRPRNKQKNRKIFTKPKQKWNKIHTLPKPNMQ